MDKDVMLHGDLVDLGDARVETRGILEFGAKDEQNDGRYVNGGISVHD